MPGCLKDKIKDDPLKIFKKYADLGWINFKICMTGWFNS
jgi:hypothetical protein